MKSTSRHGLVSRGGGGGGSRPGLGLPKVATGTSVWAPNARAGQSTPSAQCARDLGAVRVTMVLGVRTVHTTQF